MMIINIIMIEINLKDNYMIMMDYQKCGAMIFLINIKKLIKFNHKIMTNQLILKKIII